MCLLAFTYFRIGDFIVDGLGTLSAKKPRLEHSVCHLAFAAFFKVNTVLILAPLSENNKDIAKRKNKTLEIIAFARIFILGFITSWVLTC